MKTKLKSGLSASLIIGFLFIVSGFVQAQTQRIRVVVQNASIRAEPNLESDIIGSPPLGSVFEVIQKTGSWYEIKFRSQLGISMKGYMHEMFVEEKAETPAPRPEEKIAPAKAESEKNEAKEPAPKQKPAKDMIKEPAPKPMPMKDMTRHTPKASLAVMGGITFGSILNDSSSYSRSWAKGILQSVTETGSVNHRLDSPIGIGVSFSYLLLGGFGVQIRADTNLKTNLKSDGNMSSYTITWSWTDGSGPYDEEVSWPASGEMTATPISLNLIYKLQGGAPIVPYLSAGASYFPGSFKARTTGGYGFTYIYDIYRRIEHVDIPLSVDASFSGVGFNIGGGLELRLLPSLALSLDAVYFYRSKIVETWRAQTGTYAGHNFPEIALIVDQELADSISSNLSRLAINPSFFKLQAGMMFVF